MSKFAVLFPGQGSQSLGMLSQLHAENNSVAKIFTRASSVLHYDLWELTQTGPEEKLNQTEFTQPALLAADVAVWECKKNQLEKTPAFFAGHSLGEYAALVCADALSFEDAIQLVSLRGKYMQAAVPEGAGAMAAIVGLDDAVVQKICIDASDAGVASPANYNSIGQIVIAGHTASVEKAVALALQHGAKLAKKIPVSVPSHCALMQSASEKLADALRAVSIKTPHIPVVQNTDVHVHREPEKIRDALIQQLTRPVRWVETIQFLMQQHVHTFYECGPGKVLTGLNKRISKEITTENWV